MSLENGSVALAGRTAMTLRSRYHCGMTPKWRPPAQLAETPELDVQSLLKTPLISVRDVCCRGSCRHKSVEECASATHLVFVRGQPLVVFNIWDVGSAKAVEGGRTGSCYGELVGREGERLRRRRASASRFRD